MIFPVQFQIPGREILCGPVLFIRGSVSNDKGLYIHQNMVIGRTSTFESGLLLHLVSLIGTELHLEALISYVKEIELYPRR